MILSTCFVLCLYSFTFVFIFSELSIKNILGWNHCNEKVIFQFAFLMNYTGAYYVSHQGNGSEVFAFHVQYPNITWYPSSKIETADIDIYTYWNNLDYYIHNQSTKTFHGSASVPIISGLKRRESSVLCLNVTAGEGATFIPSYRNKGNETCISFQYYYDDDCPCCGKLNTL